MKTLICRLGFIIPLVFFAVYVLMALFGVVANAFGAAGVFYCSVFCKIGVTLLVLMLTGSVICQVRAHLKNT